MKYLNPFATLNLICGSIPLNFMMLVCCILKLYDRATYVNSEFPPSKTNIYFTNIDIWYMMISHCVQLISLITQSYATRYNHKYLHGFVTILRIVTYFAAFFYLFALFSECYSEYDKRLNTPRCGDLSRDDNRPK